MIPKVLPQRHYMSNVAKPFNDLIGYIREIKNPAGHNLSSNRFSDLLTYATSPHDSSTDQEKCLAIRTHGVVDVSTASLEMNAVAAKNKRCKDPTYHFILSWPEHENPDHDSIFDAAQHAIAALGMREHQYVIAIHGNTDNVHCHIAINRIHSITSLSHNITWAINTLHLAARQSEIKYGWTNDNGIYIVQTDKSNHKTIVLNPDLGTAGANSRDTKTEEILPTWHDSESLESWLKRDVAKALKSQLATLTSWSDLHHWLFQHQISLSDTGGGLRIDATSNFSEYAIQIPVSKCLRILKRTDLEALWGKFKPSPFNMVNLPKNRLMNVTQQVDTSVVNDVDLVTKKSAREQRTAQRALARADLRKRFAQYRRLVDLSSHDYKFALNEIKLERRLKFDALKFATKAINSEARTKYLPRSPELLHEIIAIDLENRRIKQEIDAKFKMQDAELRKLRFNSLSWRTWLFEQANLGDQAAVSALRGIVYQEQRDIKRQTDSATAPEQIAESALSNDDQYRQLMARLHRQEQHEMAIRPAHDNAMRPYEADALLVRHTHLKWQVTGNGNIIYGSDDGKHLFTDRGNRVTFDRIYVPDEEIRLALIHARHKFGNQLLLTGTDPAFTERMAKLADDLGISIINPECRAIIEQHRIHRTHDKPGVNTKMQNVQSNFIQPETEDSPSTAGRHMEPITDQNKYEPPAKPTDIGAYDKLRAMVLAIDPQAQFTLPSQKSNQLYIGSVVAELNSLENLQNGFAQHIGRNVYAIHTLSAPVDHQRGNIEVRYRNGTIEIQGAGNPLNKTQGIE